MFEKVNSLPGSKRQAPGNNGNGQADWQHRGLDMGRHVVWTFERVRYPRHARVVAAWHKPLKKLMKVAPNVGIGILLDYKGT